MIEWGVDAARDARWMTRALELAETAAAAGEIPVGAVLVDNADREVAAGFNRPVSEHDASAHAEIVAIRAAGRAVGNYRLPGLTLYVTLEPCVMCAGAIIQARLTGVVFGAADPKAGAAGSVYDVLNASRLNHRPGCRGGVMAEACADILRTFFRSRR